MNLGEALLERGRPNSLNLVRLLLATLVIVGHAWPLGGFGPHPEIGDTPLGEWAVSAFFCISGFLIASSRRRLPFGRFLWNRALRIFPGFWVCLVVVALVVAPLSTLASGEDYSVTSGLGYVVHDLGLYVFQSNIDFTLVSVPYPGSWNGSLWTLPYEFLAYIAAGIFLGGLLARRPAVVCVGLLLAMAIVTPWAYEHVSTKFLLRSLQLGPFFVGGMLVFSLAAKVWVNIWWATAALALLVLSTFAGDWSAVAASLPLAYLVLWLGAAMPARWAQRHDISYGVYIYAFPVQQLLALAGAQVFGLPAYIGLSILFTVPLAWASWLAVERPALALKSWGRRRRSDALPLPELG